MSGNNGLFYLHSDHLGNTSLMTNSSGVKIAYSDSRYYPFGGWRTEPTASLTDRGFTGHLHNNIGSGPDDIGLVYMQARWFLPGVGRFISADTIIPNPANPQSYNRYSYVRNSPINFIDPTGHAEWSDPYTSSGSVSQPSQQSSPPQQSSSFPGILQGLPLEGEAWKTNKYHNGFGANNFAETRQANGTYSRSGGIHPGLDFIVSAGTSVFSNVTGNIVDMYPQDGFPNVVVKVVTDEGVFYVVYGHVVLSSKLKIGDPVNPGDEIGTVWLYMVPNPDGSQFDNSHLHLAVRQEEPDGRQRVYNPVNFLLIRQFLTAFFGMVMQKVKTFTASNHTYIPLNTTFGLMVKLRLA